MDEIAEDKTADYAGTVVDPRKLRQIQEYTKEGWNVHVSPNGKRETTSQEVEKYGCKGANRKERKESRVSTGMSKLMEG